MGNRSQYDVGSQLWLVTTDLSWGGLLTIMIASCHGHLSLPPIMWFHFESLATGLHLQLFAVSCSHMSAFYNGLFQIQYLRYFQFFAKTMPISKWLLAAALWPWCLLNDCRKKAIKSGQSSDLTRFMISWVMTMIGRLHYNHNLRTICIYVKILKIPKGSQFLNTAV